MCLCWKCVYGGKFAIHLHYYLSMIRKNFDLYVKSFYCVEMQLFFIGLLPFFYQGPFYYFKLLWCAFFEYNCCLCCNHVIGTKNVSRDEHQPQSLSRYTETMSSDQQSLRIPSATSKIPVQPVVRVCLLSHTFNGNSCSIVKYLLYRKLLSITYIYCTVDKTVYLYQRKLASSLLTVIFYYYRKKASFIGKYVSVLVNGSSCGNNCTILSNPSKYHHRSICVGYKYKQ